MNQAIGTVVLCATLAAIGVGPVGVLYRRIADALARIELCGASSTQTVEEREREAEAFMKAHP